MSTMTTSAGCGCGCGGTSGGCGGHGAPLERPRYFPRQLVTPAELNLSGEYVVERLRRHNRLLHGWGVICGAQVCRVPGAGGAGPVPWKVLIRPGHAIDGLGNDVTIDCDRIVDVRVGATTAAAGDPAGEVRDPWCTDVYTACEDGGRVWVAVCHAEQRARPVRTQPSGCGCDDAGCEYSRWTDGYEVRLLDACPPSHAGPPPDPAAFATGTTIPDCPEACVEDPCVVLAAVDVAADGSITGIDNCSCRRMLVSVASLWWRCGPAVKITGVKVQPAGPYTPGKKGLTLTVAGEHFAADRPVEADLGPGVEIKSTKPGDGTVVIKADLADAAAPGERALTLTTEDCSSATWAAALTVRAAKK